MKLTIDSNEPLDDVIRVVGSLYGVNLAATHLDAVDGKPEAAGPVRPSSDGREGRTKSRRASTGGRRRVARERLHLTNAELRSWARQNGHQVSDRGRVPASVVAAYGETQQSS